MTITKAQAKLAARDFSNLKPHFVVDHKDCELCALWRKMVFAVANHGVPHTMANGFDHACNHGGIWPQ